MNNQRPLPESMNALWSQLIIEELVRLGVQHFCIAPGSRSTPLTLAAAAHPQTETHLHFDERGLGFFALGLSQGLASPVAVIVTSGSAVANLLPAVVEARQSGVPLWILTADRPAELINIGANQAISQQQIFSNYPVHQCLFPTPDNDIQPSWLLAQLDHAAFQQRQQSGPVHLNCPFREPLYPDGVNRLPTNALRGLSSWLHKTQPWTCYHPTIPGCVIHADWPDIRQQKGLIIVGRQQSPDEANAILRWAHQTGWPIIADIQSQLRFHPETVHFADLALHHPSFQKILAQADTLMLFGSRLTSKRLQQFINQHTWHTCWQIDATPDQLDSGLAVQHRFVCAPNQWCQQHPMTESNRWLTCDDWDQTIARLIEKTLPDWGEITLCHQLNQHLKGQLFISNSMPIRMLDMLGKKGKQPSQIFTNRGASGIDGLIATAAGVANAKSQPTTLLIGDTAALFDLNSLALLRDVHQPFVCIVINNDGGNIFHMLPVPQANGIREHYYQLPHGLTFEAAASQFKLAYQQIDSAAAFSTAYEAALQHPQACILECIVPTGDAAAWLKQLGLAIQQEIHQP